jgi:hypothetical protein
VATLKPSSDSHIPSNKIALELVPFRNQLLQEIRGHVILPLTASTTVRQVGSAFKQKGPEFPPGLSVF